MIIVKKCMLVEETKEGASRILDDWRETIEKKYFKISRMKMKYLFATSNLKHERCIVQ